MKNRFSEKKLLDSDPGPSDLDLGPAHHHLLAEVEVDRAATPPECHGLLTEVEVSRAVPPP
jgi:hypothetical protein